jgi:hypothetical protein
MKVQNDKIYPSEKKNEGEEKKQEHHDVSVSHG